MLSNPQPQPSGDCCDDCGSCGQDRCCCPRQCCTFEFTFWTFIVYIIATLSILGVALWMLAAPCEVDKEHDGTNCAIQAVVGILLFICWIGTVVCGWMFFGCIYRCNFRRAGDRYFLARKMESCICCCRCNCSNVYHEDDVITPVGMVASPVPHQLLQQQQVQPQQQTHQPPNTTNPGQAVSVVVVAAASPNASAPPPDPKQQAMMQQNYSQQPQSVPQQQQPPPTSDQYPVGVTFHLPADTPKKG